MNAKSHTHTNTAFIAHRAFAHSGYPLENNLWARFQYALYRFTDGNAFENAQTPASPCCSNPKGIYAKRHK